MDPCPHYQTRIEICPVATSTCLHFKCAADVISVIFLAVGAPIVISKELHKIPRETTIRRFATFSLSSTQHHCTTLHHPVALASAAKGSAQAHSANGMEHEHIVPNAWRGPSWSAPLCDVTRQRRTCIVVRRHASPPERTARPATWLAPFLAPL